MKSKLFILALLIITVCAVFAEPIPRNVWDESISNEYLVSQLESKQVQVRFDAALELGQRDCMVAAKNLINMLKNDYAYQARVGAAIALKELNCKNALPILQNQAKNDPNPVVRNVCAAIVRDFSKES